MIGVTTRHESTYSAFTHHGQVEFHVGCSATGHWLRFHLADDWQIRPESGWFPSAARPTPQSETDPIDERRVLFGRIPEFIVLAMSRHSSLRSGSPEARREILRAIHIEWLMPPRDDLGGRSPREILVDERHEHINHDVQNQSEHWSCLRKAPPGLPRESEAYRFAGFGTAEIVLYYELVRDLLWLSAGRFSQREIPDVELPAEAEFLKRAMQDWLNDPANELTHPRTAAQVIDLERRRLPIK
ncbi:MAG TPA: hypothetical protein VM510_04620, partial [Caulifigura sp.]|nr:hypothetical protein [Caulifigura sp.]